jgi:hypothetical protein
VARDEWRIDLRPVCSFVLDVQDIADTKVKLRFVSTQSEIAFDLVPILVQGGGFVDDGVVTQTEADSFINVI